MAACERIRLARGGRLGFMMDREGRPLMVGQGGAVVPGPSRVGKPTRTTEMFYCKGLAAAAWLLGDESALRRARELFDEVYADLQSGRFSSDQQQLDPRNAVVPAPGKIGHGARMVGLGAATCFLQCTGAARYREIGLEWIKYVLDHHVNTAGGKRGQLYDMWEHTDASHNQYVEGGMLKSDPGHACEFVGLGLKFLGVVQSQLAPREQDVELVASYQRLLPLVLKKNFANGFSPRGFGLIKAFDLLGRKPINDQMPWWPLPETIRAAAGAMRVVPPAQRGEYAGIAAACSNAFLAHYVRPELGLMAYQTLGPDGKPVDVIPATPDADPGYHTGLSIIDALDILDLVR
jgi:mannose/cellobiose epimerase-like protein (N-acyl-D-glucosamine 2-epimerase family)